MLTGTRRWRDGLGGLLSHQGSAVGAAIVALFLGVALLGPVIAPYGATEQIPGAARQPPSMAHLFGTDRLGRDVFSRIVIGARDVLGLAGVSTAVAVMLGAGVGMWAGYRGGLTEEVVFRVFDAVLAMPALLLALLLLGVLGPSRGSVLVVIAIVYTPIVARVTRSVVLSVKEKAYVKAARLSGEETLAILWHDIFPAVVPVLAVESALRFSYAIFLIASLGFLGVGVQPPRPDWGLMVKESRNYAALVPWALFFPGLAISMLVIGANLLADGVRGAVGAPRTKR